MKKILKIIVTVICIITYINVFGSTTLLERNESNNWGVNKKIDITSERLQIIKETKYVNAN